MDIIPVILGTFKYNKIIKSKLLSNNPHSLIPVKYSKRGYRSEDYASMLFLAFSSHRLRTLPFASFVSISRMSNFSSSRQFYACQVVD